MTKNSDLWKPVLAILLHVCVLVMAQGIIFAAILHLYLHCSPAMAVWTLLSILTLLIYCGGYRVVSYLWTVGED